MADANARTSRSWIADFEEYTAHVPSPEIYRKWTALSIVAGALERRCFTRTARGPLYPNLFVLLVGPPGVGKSVSIDEAHDLWAATGAFGVAPSGITKAALIDALKERTKSLVLSPTEMVQYHSLLIPSSEFGVLVPAHDLEFLNTLNELYDCRRVLETRTRMHGVIKIDNPHIHLLAGTQPKYLAETLPEAAFGMGFTSRMIMVYAGAGPQVEMFSAPKMSQTIRAKLIAGLARISEMLGEFEWEADAAAAFETWYAQGAQPKPAHPKLQNYNARRPTHVIKMAMALSASESSSKFIELHHVESAKELLLSTEALMPEIFREMSSRGYGDALDEAFNFLWGVWLRGGKKPVPEAKLIHFLQTRVPANQITFNIETMIKSNQIKVVGTSISMRMLEPVQVHLHGEG